MLSQFSALLCKLNETLILIKFEITQKCGFYKINPLLEPRQIKRSLSPAIKLIFEESTHHFVLLSPNGYGWCTADSKVCQISEPV